MKEMFSVYHNALWENILMKTLLLKYLNKLTESVLCKKNHLASNTVASMGKMSFGGSFFWLEIMGGGWGAEGEGIPRQTPC